MKKILIICIFLLFTITANTMRFVKSVYVIEENKELTVENIVDYMREIGLVHKDILLSQIHQETGNLKHIKYENNLFGFRTDKYLTFDTWEDCIDYMKIWQDKHWTKYNKNGENDYYAFLINKKYAEDQEYTIRLKKIAKKYKYVEK